MQTIHREALGVLQQQAAEILEGFAQAAIVSCGDFGQVEESAHAALLKLRFVVMSAGLALSSQSSRRTYQCPACGKALHGWNLAERRVVTAEGEATYRPVRSRCPGCAKDYYPLEEANGLRGSQFTTGAKALIGKAGAQSPYAHVSEWLLEERGLPVSAKEVDRTVREVSSWRRQEEDRLRGALFGEEAAHLRAAGGDPLEAAAPLFEFGQWEAHAPAKISVDGAMVRSCVKGPDGNLEWFEHRAGLIAPAGEDAPGQAAYVGGVCSPDALFDLLAAAWRRGGHSQRPGLFVADGARWIWDRATLYFPEAAQVLDIYHAGEHVASAANACWGEGSAEALKWRRAAREMLLESHGPQKILQTLIRRLKRPEQVADPAQLRKEFRYLYHHRHRMRYHALKQQDLPVGSGAMESAIKQLSVQRLRQPGMKWTREGADSVLRIRAALLSGSFNQTVQRRHDALKRSTERCNTQPYALAG